jgi:N-methylhydantoinase A
MIAEARIALEAAGTPPDIIRYAYGADMRYAGQQNEVTVDFSVDPSVHRDIDAMREAFETAYELQYGLRLPDMQIQVVAWRISAHGPAEERHGTPELADEAGTPKSHREVLIGDKSMSVAVYDRTALTADQKLPGPVIIEERETTIFILPRWNASVAENGCITAERKG